MENLMKKLYATIDEKNVRNKKLIDGIFDIMFDGSIKENAFDDELSKTREYTYFMEKYIEPIANYDEHEEMWDALISVIMETRRVAFKIGFQAALKLILESEGRAMPFIRLDIERKDGEEK